MTLLLVNLTGSGVVPARATLRASFERTVFGLGGDPDAQVAAAYARLQEKLPGTGAGYVASPLAALPGASSFTVDVRAPAAGQLTAGAVAQALQAAVGNLGPDKFELVRLALVGNETAADAAAGRDNATAEVDAAPSWWDRAVSGVKGAAWWLVVVLAIVAVLVLSYFLRT